MSDYTDTERELHVDEIARLRAELKIERTKRQAAERAQRSSRKRADKLYRRVRELRARLDGQVWGA